ncbi:MAG: hypothetical protein HYY48_03135 [Gammaproteobacteria bacterium]|nr:hypothetical protein [Gammaproteobacteria bacterium]
MRIIICSALVLLLTACGGGSSTKRLESLEEAINHYAQAMRWGRYDDAEAFHMSRDGQRYQFNLEGLESVRITGYAVRERQLNDNLVEAEVAGEYSYFNTSYGTLRHAPFQQKWWYNTESKRWFVEGGLPEFK